MTSDYPGDVPWAFSGETIHKVVSTSPPTRGSTAKRQNISTASESVPISIMPNHFADGVGQDVRRDVARDW